MRRTRPTRSSTPAYPRARWSPPSPTPATPTPTPTTPTPTPCPPTVSRLATAFSSASKPARPTSTRAWAPATTR
ncbi:hypothetical protein FIV42_09380 [Persicimonas caeni]|uniref:Uncharacterized protein n=1 Tax=Persicimonas caeni TaxID=2292766 RepID=A0A4Y6PRJ2_PERCE|nr:hypothetical protein FIV42_09380 [Persicimonas caeni]QED32157.1 hypothetical protein FRD00_09375 [Persicimonas caeni]